MTKNSPVYAGAFIEMHFAGNANGGIDQR
jgi:hypothetical protein